MLLWRIAWILGLISTRGYHARIRQHRFGASLTHAPEAAIRDLDRSLLEDRCAVVLFLISAVILVYTFLNAPALT